MKKELFFQKFTFQYFIFSELLLFRLIFCTNTLGLPVVLAKQLADNCKTTGRQLVAYTAAGSLNTCYLRFFFGGCLELDIKLIFRTSCYCHFWWPLQLLVLDELRILFDGGVTTPARYETAILKTVFTSASPPRIGTLSAPQPFFCEKYIFLCFLCCIKNLEFETSPKPKSRNSESHA